MKMFDKIIHFFQEKYIPMYEEEVKENDSVKPYRKKSFEPSVNPATGMPMIGSVDCMGNPFGQRFSNESYSSSYDYYRYQSSYDVYNRSDSRWTNPFNR